MTDTKRREPRARVFPLPTIDGRADWHDIAEALRRMADLCDANAKEAK